MKSETRELAPAIPRHQTVDIRRRQVLIIGAMLRRKNELWKIETRKGRIAMLDRVFQPVA
jgi:hypothetical protein